MRRIAGVALVLSAIVIPQLRASAQQSARVEIRNTYFSPSEIHVPAGGTVEWSTAEGNHSVTADDGSFDSNPSCTTLLLVSCMSSGDTFEHRFSAAATVTYHCRVHGDAMTGKVIVDPASSTTTSSTTSTTATTTATSTTVTSTSLTSDQSTVSQAPLPAISQNSRVVLPKSITRSDDDDGFRPLVLVAIGIAGVTTAVGIVLVRRGRVPLG